MKTSTFASALLYIPLAFASGNYFHLGGETTKTVTAKVTVTLPPLRYPVTKTETKCGWRPTVTKYHNEPAYTHYKTVTAPGPDYYPVPVNYKTVTVTKSANDPPITKYKTTTVTQGYHDTVTKYKTETVTKSVPGAAVTAYREQPAKTVTKTFTKTVTHKPYPTNRESDYDTGYGDYGYDSKHGNYYKA
ncbi:hypothetical protein ACLX1H_004545 [Fusarium chlamydosporum]